MRTIYAALIVHCSEVHYQWFSHRTLSIPVNFGARIGRSSSDDAIDIVGRGLFAYAPHCRSLDCVCNVGGSRNRD